MKFSNHYFPLLLLIFCFALQACKDGGSSKKGPSSNETANKENRVPVVSNRIQDFTLEVGVDLTLQVSAEDPDGDSLSFNIENLPQFISASDNNNGKLSLIFAAEAGDEGEYHLSIDVSDGEGVTNTSFSVRVVNSSSTGMIDDLNDFSIEEAGSEVSRIPVNRIGANEVHIDNLVAPDFANIFIGESNDLVIELAPKFGSAGVYTVDFELNDGFRKQKVIFEIVVTQADFIPEIIFPEEIIVSEGTETTHEILSAEIGSLVSVTSSTVPEFGEIVQSDSGKIDLILGPGYKDAGIYKIEVTFHNGSFDSPVFDMEVTVEQSFSGEASTIDAGAFHTCALEQETVYCWGLNDVGQAKVPAHLGDVTHLAAGEYHTCAADENGISCWGRNFNGEASPPEGTINVSKLAAGYEHTCVLSNGQVKCWGSNTDGFGADVGQSRVPDSLGVVTDISAGFFHTCALDEAGLQCWGSNHWKQSDTPSGLSSVTSFGAGRLITCAAESMGLSCWGTADGYGQNKVPDTVVLPDLFEIGYFYNSCAFENGELICWGAGSSDTNNWPHFGQGIVPQNLNNISSLTLGMTHACVIDSGSVSCWGAGEESDGQGDYHFGQSIVPSFLQAP
ncbi:Ig-like domain-containing protein [Microbulbifer sp. THAF38]|uniref:RCC1 domain-containing protein n=1 Tax=Microbulbifer sp. THAF38 TaxID=2587856 RepID=UPI00126909FA|nr:Ig-like domain-containing protein [Microbulbifer sp. THAF38]